jgi:hypothetical protein
LEALREDRWEREEAAQQIWLDRKHATAQLQLDWESLDARAREAKERAAACKDAWLKEAQEATQCWEANQERLDSAQAVQQEAQE